ncbi:hypothetical protein [Lactococcus taiwanensis]|nr:hypothetical protein P7266_1451 [Lactococcus cremoris]
MIEEPSVLVSNENDYFGTHLLGFWQMFFVELGTKSTQRLKEKTNAKA